MICQRCKLKESTGILVHLCDECYDQWEKEVQDSPSAFDITPIDLALRNVSGGGLVPDDVRSVVLRGSIDDVRVDYVREN